MLILKVFSVIFVFSSGIFASNAEAQIYSEEEAFFLRRIADFWQEGEVHLVKLQIEGFLSETKCENHFTQSLRSMLADLYFREKNYLEANSQYMQLEEGEKRRFFFNRCHCLLELGQHPLLTQECTDFLSRSELSDEERIEGCYFLATGLYQQCVNAPTDLQLCSSLSQASLPYFEKLIKSPKAKEITQAYAQMCVFAEAFDKSAELYLLLADQNGSQKEEMLFYAGLAQAKFDKELAIQTFARVEEMKSSWAQEAFFNLMLLSFETGKFENLLKDPETLFQKVAPERREMLFFLLGKSCFQLEHYKEAIGFFSSYIETARPSTTLHTALLDMLEIAYKVNDAEAYESSLEKLTALFPNDSQLPKAILSHAFLLKVAEKWDAAYSRFEKIVNEFPMSSEKELAHLQCIEICQALKKPEEARELCQLFLNSFPTSPEAHAVWRSLLAASMQIEKKKSLIDDLNNFLSSPYVQSEEERFEISFFLAQSYFELREIDSTISLLEDLPRDDSAPHQANTQFLRALCAREKGELENFCTLTEELPLEKITLLPRADIHLALFNSYRTLSLLDAAAEHLYEANKLTSIQSVNLQWLANYYWDFWKTTSCKTAQQRGAEVYSSLFASIPLNCLALDECSLSFEKDILQFIELQEESEQLLLLESLQDQIQTHPSWNWQETKQVTYLLANIYLHQRFEEKALPLFEKILLKSPTLRSFPSAASALQYAKIQKKRWEAEILSSDSPSFIQSLAYLKDLVLQKTLLNEPIHLEAALEYIDLQASLDKKENLPKRLSLLIKTKEEFEATQTPLARQYHEQRKAIEEKNQIYSEYFQWIDLEILFCKIQDPKQIDQEGLKKTLVADLQSLFESPYFGKRAHALYEKLTEL